MSAPHIPWPPLPRLRRHFGELLMPPLHPTTTSLLKSLISLCQDILSIQQRTLCQRRNISLLSHRIKVLLILLEEVRDTTVVLPPSGILCFTELHVVLQGVRLLSEDCVESSRLCLLMEHRRISQYFQRLTQEMATALELLPIALLDVSCEVQEQLDLVRTQAKRAKIYIDPIESRLWREVQSVMAKIERKEAPETCKLSKIFSDLQLTSAADCQKELERLEAEDAQADASEVIQRRRLENRKMPLSDMVSLVRYCKCVLYGATEMVEEVSNYEAMSVDGYGGDLTANVPDIKVPDDFLCPISLELMRDPVVVATGQTYERAEISRWIADGHRTCPKSRLQLVHTTLIPNFALRSLIRQWCLQHNVHYLPISAMDHPFPRHTSSPLTPTALEATKLTAEFLLRQLPSASPDMQRHIAGELRVLAKCGSDNRKVIAEAGAIPLLISLLCASDVRTQEHVVTAILNLSIYAPNKARVMEAPGAVDHLISLLQKGSATSDVVRENVGALIFSLSQVVEYAAELGKTVGTIKGLLHVVRHGSWRGKQDAASALFNLAVHQPNRAVLVEEGVVEIVLALLSQPERGGVEEEALALLAVLAGCSEGRRAIAETATTALPLLVELLHVGGPKGKENAAAILLRMCRHGPAGSSVLTDIQGLYNVLPCLDSLLKNGTPRARRKAASLLRLLLRS